MIGLDQHILSIANQINKPITNLQLQKIWYFTLGYLIKSNQIKLAKSEFKKSNLEAWLYGPVVPSIHYKYKNFKSFPINDKGSIITQFNQSDINKFIKKLININVFILIELSRQHKFWQDYEHQIKHAINKPKYQFKDIIYAFKDQKASTYF